MHFIIHHLTELWKFTALMHQYTRVETFANLFPAFSSAVDHQASTKNEPQRPVNCVRSQVTVGMLSIDSW